MKKEYRDGLYFDNSILLTDMKKNVFPVQTRLFQALAVLIGSWSTLSVFLESIPIPAKISSVYITITLCFAFVYILCLIPSYNIVKLFFCLLFYTLFFVSRFKALQNGFYILENAVIKQLVQYYGVELVRFVADYETAAKDSTMLMIMIAIPLVSLITIAIAKGRLIKITFLILLLPIAASFILGVTPSEKYLVAYIAAVLYITRLGFWGNHSVNMKQKKILHRINSWAGVWLSLISLVLFFALKLLISQDSYNELTQLKVMKNEIQNKLSSIKLESISETVANYRLPSLGGTKGGLDGGALHRTGKVEYTGSEHLRVTVTAPDGIIRNIYSKGFEGGQLTDSEYIATVTASDVITNGLYLKGFVGSEYTGERWIGHTEDVAANYRELQDKLPDNYPLNQTIELISSGIDKGLLDNNPYKIKVEYINANKRFLYAPYFTDYKLMNNINYNQDLYVSPSRQADSHTFSYYNLMDMTAQDTTVSEFRWVYASLLGEDYSDYEREYRSFVEKTYTKVPEKGLELLKAKCQYVLDNIRFNTVEEKIAYIKNYLRMNTSYTLNPGQLPENVDYVEYFLFKNKKGFCAHYASTAVLMLRLFGVPARYVEGYIVSSSELLANRTGVMTSVMVDRYFKELQISIKDYNAHAWVEVYMNGIGWIPVEFTPPSGIGYNAYIREAATATPTITPTDKLTATPTIEPTPNTQKPDDTKPANKPENTTKPDEQQKDSFPWLPVLFSILTVLLTIEARMLWRVVRLRRAGNNDKAIYYYVKIDKILRFVCAGKKKRLRLEDDEEFIKESCNFIDGDALESFMNIIRKARYGRGRISGSELFRAKRLYNGLYSGIYKRLPFMKKAFLKLMLLFY